MSDGLPTTQSEEQQTFSNATVGLSESTTAAAAFVDFQETINLVKEQLLGTVGEEGEEMSLEVRVESILLAILQSGPDANGELPALVQAIQLVAWEFTDKMLFGAGEGERSELRNKIDEVLPAAIQWLITGSDENNALKNMNENINKLIHGLHILGDNVIPHLQQSLVDIQSRHEFNFCAIWGNLINAR